MTEYLTVEQIAAAVDLPEEDVPVPEWGGTIRVRGLTKGEQQQIRREARIDGEIDTQLVELLMVQYGCVEPRLDGGAVELLRSKSAVAVERLIQAIARANVATPEVFEETKRRFRKGP
ncbi:MAG: hypothetical protein V2A79_03800 [Planctomycetota bacterium]